MNEEGISEAFARERTKVNGGHSASCPVLPSKGAPGKN